MGCQIFPEVPPNHKILEEVRKTFMFSSFLSLFILKCAAKRFSKISVPQALKG
jgi:hypothetical protein